jgi:hypothetical protein
MYSVDDRDVVRPLPGIPQSSVGAPIPVVLCDENRTVVAFYLQDTPPGWDGSTVTVVSADSSDEPIAIVRFTRCFAQTLGPPNDEAFKGHPLASRGLKPYGSFEVVHSSWVRRMEQMNSVHPSHRSEVFADLRHIVLTFHDSTFECVCGGFDVRTTRGSIASVVPTMVSLLEWRQD